MRKQHLFSEFTRRYPVQKTLRFELIPNEKTKEYIETKGFIKRDNQRAEDYKAVKEMIDEYHKHFIEESLNGLTLKGLDDFLNLFTKSTLNDEDKKKLAENKKSLRKQIADEFKKNEKFKTLFKGDLIKKDLVEFIKTDTHKKELVNKFSNFTTYFTGFHENRKNIYTADEKATAIAYRLIHENLPKFIDNIKVYEKIKGNAPELLGQMNNILSDMEEIIQGKTLDEIFSVDFFNETLTQTGIELYNTVIGGRSDKQTKIKGLNEYINTDYNQQQKDKRNRLPKFKQLYKQILSDRGTVSFVAEAFENDSEVLESIEKFYQNELCCYESDDQPQPVNVFNALRNQLKGLINFDLSKIYIRNDRAVTDISQKIFHDWSIIHNALHDWYIKHHPIKKRESQEKFEERVDKWVKKSDYFDINTIQEALTQTDNEVLNGMDCNNIIVEYFGAPEKFLKKEDNATKNLNPFDMVAGQYKKVKDLLNVPYPKEKQLVRQKGTDSDVEKLKNFLESIMDIIHFIKPLDLKDESKEKDLVFYNLFKPLFEQLSKAIMLYNKVRNYVTQKPYSTEKIKLNFENSTLLDGWDVNKEPDNTAVILRKDGYYYLGIMDKKENKIFVETPSASNGDDAYEKMNYKLLPGANKMLPKVFFSKSRIDYFNPSKEVIENYSKETHKKGNNFNIKDCHALIDFFKKSLEIHEDWHEFNFRFSPTKSYEDLSGFYREVEHQGYKLTFKNIPADYINKKVNEGKLYLFKIYNKDFSSHSKGKPNLHTLYWKMLFDEENLKDVVYKLNGQAEIFFRERSITENIIVHKAGKDIENKNPDNPKKQSCFDYDIIKNKRYTLDKFQFHVPITMNYKSTGRNYINEEARLFLKNNPDVNIIGIDRGERHLAYYTVINQKREILDQGSFNSITNQHKETAYTTDYHNLLDKKEGDRNQARKSWDTIGTIKELKEGYISQVVHKIAQLMIHHNAIVVFEDLNFGFKRGRQKVEKQVYQKLEKMLIDKLNYLVFKDNKAGEPGGLLGAFQLANKFESFEKLGKQCGFIFYVQAALTSKIDPATGFVNFLRAKYESIPKAKAFFSKFDFIRFNPEKNYFEFGFDYTNYTSKASESRTKWVVCTNGDVRYKYNRQSKTSEEVNVTHEITTLLDKYAIEYKDGNCIKSSFVTQENKEFYSTLMYLLSLTLSLRYSKSGTDIDFILSPVANKNGNFFDSRNAGDKMPKDADANGAYHIALKGLLALNKINKADDKDMKKLNLAIGNKEWLGFVQQ